MSIVVISDDKDFANQTASKLVFLRDNDSIKVSDYENAVFNSREVNIALVCENPSKNLTLDLVKNLRENKDLCIILLTSSYDRNFILSAYDCGIDDFAQTSADDFELVIRIVNNLKRNSVKRSLSKKESLLKQIKVTDDVTGFYNYKLAKLVFENAIAENDLKNLVFIALSPSNAFKSTFSADKMSDAIKSSIRYTDTVSLGNGGVFYILLAKTDINGGLVVLNKIKENYDGNSEFAAGLMQVTSESFEKIEKETLHALSNAIATNAEFVIVNTEEENLDEWLGSEELKNYKIFKQIFNKKLEKVITPVFYALQEAWEEKLFNTEIEQYTNSEQCVFSLKNKKQNSTLRIIYPGFAKIILTITHEGLDSPENREIQLPLSKVTRKNLISIIEDFIKEFKSVL